MKAIIIALLMATNVYAGQIQCLKDHPAGKVKIIVDKHHKKAQLVIKEEKHSLKCTQIETVITCETYKNGPLYRIEMSQVVNQRLVKHFPVKIELILNNILFSINDTVGIVPCLESK